MPIGEAHKSGISFTGLAEYILAQGIYTPQLSDKKPEIIFRNHLFSSNYLELGSEFRDIAKDNLRVTKPVMHLTVNFKETDRISNDTQKKFVKRIMDEMGVREDNHQFLVVKHNDKHPHYHIEINRIGFDGKTLSDSNSKLRIGTACDKIEKEMGLDNYLQETRVFVYDEISKTYKKNENLNRNKSIDVVKQSRNRKVGIQEKKDFIQIATLKTLDNHRVNSLEQLQQELKKQKIDLQYTVNSKEQVAVSFRYDGLAVKGSQISLKGSLIKNQLLSNEKVINQLDDKKEQIDLLKAAYPKLIKSMEQMVEQYNAGKMPDIKLIFAENQITYNNSNTIEYKNLKLELPSFQVLEQDCKFKLEKGKEIYDSNLKKYNALQKVPFEKGFLGILSSEQKRFNSALTERLKSTKPPTLDVAIKTNDFVESLTKEIKKEFVDISSEKITRYMNYIIDNSIKQIMNKELADKKETNTKGNTIEPGESKSKNNALARSSQATEDEEEPVVRRKMRRSSRF
ncbi:MAG: hypothetical protein GZ091_10295 [Paludibacter sp.]|nr:hypothetical protein [Paludibacter sp.]